MPSREIRHRPASRGEAASASRFAFRRRRLAWALGIRPPQIGEYLIGRGVPGVVNADEEEEQLRGADAEQRIARVCECLRRRCCQNCICDEREYDVKQLILEI